MPKILLLVLLLTPVLALAECGFSRADGTMTIMVGKNANRCFSNGFREAFVAELKDALEAESGTTPPRFVRRRPPVLDTMLMDGQAPGGRYYGQR